MNRVGSVASVARAWLGIVHGSRAFGGPAQVSLNTTNRCNIRCLHCYFYSPAGQIPNEFEVRRARMDGRALPPADEMRKLLQLDADAAATASLIDEALAMGTRRFQFGGNGELFLHPDCLNLIARAKAGGARCHAYSNGTLLDEELIDELVRVRFDELRITPLAGTAEAFARTHPVAPPGTFERLRAALIELGGRRRSCGAAVPRLRLACVVFGENCGNLLDFARFGLEVRADMVVFRPFDDVEDPGLRTLVPSQEQAATARRQLAEARKLLDSHGVPHNIDRFLMAFQRQLDTTDLYRTVPCYYGWLTLRVDLDGSAYPCCRCYRALGNVHEDGVRAVWHGEAYRTFRREALALPKRGSPVEGCDCYSCVHYVTNTSVFRCLHPLQARFGPLHRAPVPRGSGGGP